MVRHIFLAVILFQLALAPLAFSAEKKFIVGFRKDSITVRQNKHDKLHRAGGRVKRDHAHINAVSVSLSDSAVMQLRNDPHVAYIEEDSLVAVGEPLQLPMANQQEYADSWGVKRIGADSAALKGITGTGIKVAILDTGIDPGHPDLIDNYKGGYNFVYDNNDPFDDSRYGHGTHLAGIIAAKDNGTGVVGVAPDASIYAVKVLNGGLMGSTSDILAGIEWAITNKMDVINMSFGAPMDSQAFRDACDLAYRSGILLVAAAGNFNQPVVDNPAGFDSVIAVSATGQDDSRAPFSNYGAKVEIAAPGVAIKSTIPGGGYGVMNGTSQSVPHVVGVAALVMSAGLRDVAAVRSRLTATAHDLGDSGRDMYFGYGLVDASKAAYYTVVASGTPGTNDVLKVSLKPGTYKIEFANHGLKKLIVRNPPDSREFPLFLPQNSELDGNNSTSDYRNRSVLARFNFNPNKPKNVSFHLKLDSADEILFHPHGKAGTSADISITAN